MRSNDGLTLIELLIVLGVIAVLATISFVAIDPASRFAQSRNTQRYTDVATLFESIHDAFIDEDGALAGDIADIDTDAGTIQMIVGTGVLDCSTLTCGTLTPEVQCVNLSGMEGVYFAEVPVDPSTGAPEDTQYYVNYENGLFTVGACSPEEERNGNTPEIELSR